MQIKLPRFVGQFLSRQLQKSLPAVGSTVTPPAALKLSGPSLLYFKAEACVGCDKLDMFIGRLAAELGLNLRVIDARQGELPAHAYGDSLLLDSTGELRRTYGVKVFPTLIQTNAHDIIHAALMGVDSEAELRRGLKRT